MRKRFKPGETFVVGQSVEIRHGSHWRAGTVIGKRETDTLGMSFYPVLDTAPSSRTAMKGDNVRGYPGSIRSRQ